MIVVIVCIGAVRVLVFGVFRLACLFALVLLKICLRSLFLEALRNLLLLVQAVSLHVQRSGQGVKLDLLRALTDFLPPNAQLVRPVVVRIHDDFRVLARVQAFLGEVGDTGA